MSECREQARRNILAKSTDANDPLASPADVLRNVVLLQQQQQKGNGPTGITYHTLFAMTLLQQHLLRQRDRAKAIALSKTPDTLVGWKDIETFCAPFFSHVLENMDGDCCSPDRSNRIERLLLWLQSSPSEQRSLYSTAVMTFSCAQWMTVARNQDNWNALLELVCDLSASLIKILAAESSKDSSVVQTRETSSELEILRLKCARTTAGCLAVAAKLPQQIQSTTRQISYEAISMYKKNQARHAHPFRGEFELIAASKIFSISSKVLSLKIPLPATGLGGSKARLLL